MNVLHWIKTLWLLAPAKTNNTCLFLSSGSFVDQAFQYAYAQLIAQHASCHVVFPPFIPSHFAFTSDMPNGDTPECAQQTSRLARHLQDILEQPRNSSSVYLTFKDLFIVHGRSSETTQSLTSLAIEEHLNKLQPLCSATVENVLRNSSIKFFGTAAIEDNYRYPLSWNYRIDSRWFHHVNIWIDGHLTHVVHLLTCNENQPDRDLRGRRSFVDHVTREIAKNPGNRVYFASDMDDACTHPIVAHIQALVQFECVSRKHLHLDRWTRWIVESGYEWLPDFVILALPDQNPHTISYTHQCDANRTLEFKKLRHLLSLTREAENFHRGESQ